MNLQWRATVVLLLLPWLWAAFAFQQHAQQQQRPSPQRYNPLYAKDDKHRQQQQQQQQEASAENSRMMISRRNAILGITSSSAIIGTALSAPLAANAEDSPKTINFGASWSAVEGLNSLDEKLVSFDMGAYRAMKDDKTRTPLFQQAIRKRLGKDPESQVVLDLGTGPFALFALIAAEEGAGKVIAIEANPQAAASARAYVKKAGFDDVVQVVEGFSTEVELTEKVDFCIAEIMGSIASEEGAFATIQDARRFLKEPNKDSSWIPCRIQTYAAPASYTLHNLFGPPEFDWTKLKGEPVRFNCRDKGLELLANPQLVEDVTFAKQQQSQTNNKQELSFVVDKDRIEDNTMSLVEEFRRNNKSSPQESQVLGEKTAHSFSGIALWPRLYLDDEIVVNSRQYGNGNHQKSHWQTVLPIMSARPIANLQGGERIDISCNFDLPLDVKKPPRYSIQGVLNYT